MSVNPVTWLADCRTQCKAIKSLAEPFNWGFKKSRPKAFVAVSALLNDKGVAIPKLRVEFVYEQREYGEYQSYALMYTHTAATYRVFMLEVLPKFKVGHREPGLIVKGPHLLLGDPRIVGQSRTRPCIRKAALSQHVAWMEIFRKHASIQDGAYSLSTVSGPIFSANAPQLPKPAAVAGLALPRP